MPDTDWTIAAASLQLQQLLWERHADAAATEPLPALGDMGVEYGCLMAGVFRQAARVTESFADRCREMAYAEQHRDVGRLDSERPPRGFAVVRDTA